MGLGKCIEGLLYNYQGIKIIVIDRAERRNVIVWCRRYRVKIGSCHTVARLTDVPTEYVIGEQRPFKNMGVQTWTTRKHHCGQQQYILI